MKKEFKYIVMEDQAGERVDAFLTVQEEIVQTRSQVNRLIKDGNVLVNGKIAKPGIKLKENDQVFITVPAPKKLEVAAENIPLDVVFEDKDLIVVNKARGMVVHPAVGNYEGTLVNALLYHCKDLSGIGGVLRPGIVHRLDKDTSGLIVVAKNDFTHQALAEQFKAREISKQYVALVHGVVSQDEGVIETEIGRHHHDRKRMAVIKTRDQGLFGPSLSMRAKIKANPKFQDPSFKQKGREAITEYKVLQRFKDYTLLAVVIKTGRTHQIRVHLNHLGYGVVGDPIYGKRREKYRVSGQLLHSAKLGFIHPRTGKRVEFDAELPEDMQRILKLLG
ncbi:RNA pseudouridine synthase [candidate division WOR-1 bacterium RIFOXYB2_FULL_42_35]|uniref:RNA pseudouridylate synthase n=1 Tax=candidate division WOR-1 bacterium RIFOXYC2_FULL_41_25 TaxID=1802586 RepID=A0A1F4TQF7_UNCSA|nr:MAG: RNA pseudouridine synthase [candidate division WOR-1 bacterium RIFOXYA2_FULL_41_14]OGC25530.1 MAG: RNA pseudouridine synthase [candidate division WOR-1 bacterium RIFOXYB2_FULL_42_35]OGC34962.1 MAG: RNA pseudouridine synthase [candidate division WOR-1 bacterium RIFOXYC2_FULL_41_25]OGC41525.1 MAG: RNA pseudouridine synthase [candidate division WOR-1 bacterium RIFOXYD2_FULL_41_8]